MHSTGYVVLPRGLSRGKKEIAEYIHEKIGKYSSAFEVAPYRRYFTADQIRRFAAHRGFGANTDAFALHILQTEPGSGVEEGRLYLLTTHNPHAKYDYYTIIWDKFTFGSTLAGSCPLHLVLPDGSWHSALDYGYRPLRDFKAGGRHPANNGATREWTHFLAGVFAQYATYRFAVLDIHS